MGRWVAMAVLTAAVLGGCNQAYINDNNVLLLNEQQVDAAKSVPHTVVVDVRKPEEYAAGHIPGAINIFLPSIQAGDARLSDAVKVIVYGQGPLDPLPRAAAKRMLALGYQGVDVYIGGIEYWQRAGKPIVK